MALDTAVAPASDVGRTVQDPAVVEMVEVGTSVPEGAEVDSFLDDPLNSLKFQKQILQY